MVKLTQFHFIDHEWTLAHGFFANMGGFVVHDNGVVNYVLDPGDIDTYLRNGQIIMTEEDIRDKSKGDILTKGLVVLQTVWFVLQLLARAIERLPVTELEIATLAFSALNGGTYLLWWNKPLDVQRPIILMHHTWALNIEAGDGGVEDLIDETKRRQEHNRRVSSVPFLDSGVHNEGTPNSNYILAAVGLLFGGVHCIAWASHFPTPLERLLWQIASLLTIVVPIIFAIYDFASSRVDLSRPTEFVFALFIFVPYTIARLFLLVLAFATLRSLPLDAYTTVYWTTFVPHI